jgi:hypothetical protein
MGQAKYRKAADPNFGKPPPMPDYRGLIVSPPIIASGNLISGSSNLDPQELRFSLLFWDKLVWPTGQIHFGEGETEKQLIDCGVMERPHYNFYGGAGDIVLRTQMQAFHDYNDKAPGAWALAQGENSLKGLGKAFEFQGGGALIELCRAIPIPSADVPVNEILELKEHRRDELMRFRHHMEAMSEEVANTAEKTAKLEMHLKEVNAACADLMALGKEWRWPMHITSLNCSLNLKPSLVGQVIGAWEFGDKYCTELAVASAAAVGMYRGIKVNQHFNIKLRSPKHPATPYRYAYRIHTELGQLR